MTFPETQIGQFLAQAEWHESEGTITVTLDDGKGDEGQQTFWDCDDLCMRFGSLGVYRPDLPTWDRRQRTEGLAQELHLLGN